MRNIFFEPDAWLEFGFWLKNDVKTANKIYALLENIMKTPFDGLGKPEPLKSNYSGYWSRRISQEHRLVYKVENGKIVVMSVKEHY
ncbi:MAG: Txe/YoeB family addiction module toxin [Chitinivibrionia bacterium]|nr:Txe/YoeB family addiction module toxin [Chitinivibrionia bacterium]